LIYADTSALVKLITREAESEVLHAWLGRQDEPIATNMVGVVELQRVAARIDTEAVAAVVPVLQRLDRLEITGSTYDLAAILPPTTLRCLDALHVASAAQARSVSCFLTYDVRMADAAELVGLPVVSPSS
jgi:predicted nucleic acid-binding protein